MALAKGAKSLLRFSDATVSHILKFITLSRLRTVALIALLMSPRFAQIAMHPCRMERTVTNIISK